MIAEIPALRNSGQSPVRRKCPDCGGLLLLEPVYGDGYWWSCLLCGWNKPAEGVEVRKNSVQPARNLEDRPRSTRIPSRAR